MVSTHMSPNAAKVVRIAKPDRNFGVFYPHSSARFLASDGSWTFATVDEEDLAWYKFGNSKNFIGRFIQGVISFVNYVRRMQLPAKSPIPGSSRFIGN